MYIKNPIRIVQQMGMQVQFQVEQTWVTGGSLTSLAVMYEDTADMMQCPLSSHFEGITSTYSAVCVKDVAEIALFVRDYSFRGLDDISGQIPPSCEKRKAADIKVDGDIKDWDLSADFLHDMYKAGRPDYYSGWDLGGKAYSRYDCATNTVCIMVKAEPGRIIAQSSENTWFKDYTVKLTGEKFVLKEPGVKYVMQDVDGDGDLDTVGWEACFDVTGLAKDIRRVEIHSNYGLVNGGTGDTLSTGKDSNQALINLDLRCSTGGEMVMFFFTIPCNPMDTNFCIPDTLCPETAQPGATPVAAPVTPPTSGNKNVGGSKTNIVMSQEAQDDVEDNFALTTNIITCDAVHEEMFDKPGDALSWENGVESQGDGFGNFLGRFGAENPQVLKTFKMPTQATKATVKFTFYDINGNADKDKLMFGIQNSWVEVNLESSDKQYHKDETVTVSTRPSTRVGFLVDATSDREFDIEMSIPKRWWENHGYELPIGFKVLTEKSVDESSYGIDNFVLVVDCGAEGRRAKEAFPPESEPSEEGDDGSYYCKAVDYPCGQANDMVYVCHYSTRVGYQTFCIPEADSEVLRFYRSDYCGPCVGGFGGVNMQ